MNLSATGLPTHRPMPFVMHYLRPVVHQEIPVQAARMIYELVRYAARKANAFELRKRADVAKTRAATQVAEGELRAAMECATVAVAELARKRTLPCTPFSHEQAQGAVKEMVARLMTDSRPTHRPGEGA